MAKAQTDTILQLSPDELMEREGWNVRLVDDPDNQAHIVSLAESIFHVGVLQPLTAYRAEGTNAEGEAQYVITDGHCRLLAVRAAMARGAPIKTIPVRLEPKGGNDEQHTFSIVARNSGKPLSQLELGIACARLIAFGWKETGLAEKSGYSLQHIRNVLLLANAGNEVTKLVETGQVAASLAVQAIAAEGAGAGETLQAAVDDAKAEAASKPTKKPRGGQSAAVKPVKATMKNVARVKAKNGVTLAKPLAKKPKAQKQPELSSMVTDAKALQILRESGDPIAIFDEQFGKRRGRILDLLLSQPASSAGNGQGGAELTTLTTILGRAVADDPDESNIVTLVMDADDWRTVCNLLKIKQPGGLSAEDLREHTL